ncbi:MAG: hypothetical protein DME50_10975 [Verrucomicrobia bacterium]|nr:MAG: hypothetical protein DME50_10975 [Verrucomicrobiota bacterium]
MITYPKTDVRYWRSRLFKHSRKVRSKAYVDNGWSVRIGHENHQQRFSLGTSNKTKAATKARGIYMDLQARGWSAVKRPAQAKCDATIGEFVRELIQLHASKAATIQNYAAALRKIAADIAKIPSGGGGGNAKRHTEWREKVEALKLSFLTPARIQSWKENFIARAGRDPVKIRSARVSVNSFLREARSLFSPRYTENLDGIALPDPLPFAGIKLEKRSMPRYQSSFDVAALVHAACDELATNEPEQFKIFVLAVMAGLRRNEIDKLEWSRFNWSQGTITIQPTAVFRTKSDESIRTVWIPPQMMSLFRSYHDKTGGAYVIESGIIPILGKAYEHYRCTAIFEKLIAWLRAHGVNGQKPLHTLRKEYGSQVAARFGIYAAQQMLGHADIATTAMHYLETKDRPMVGLGHLLTD